MNDFAIFEINIFLKFYYVAQVLVDKKETTLQYSFNLSLLFEQI